MSKTPIENTKFIDGYRGEGEKGDVTIEDVNRVLEVGRILLSVLTEEEIAEIQRLFNQDGLFSPVEK